MTEHTDERAGFEAWWSSPHVWSHGHKEAQWAAWQAARRAPVVSQRCDLCKNNGGYFYGRTGYEPCCVGSLAPQPPEVKGSVSNVTLAEPVQMPENIREGEPYDEPAFEALAREQGVWGTAQSAVCAQFWIAAKEQST